MPSYTLVTPHLPAESWHAQATHKLVATAAPYPQLLATLCQWDVLPVASISAHSQGLKANCHWLKATPIALNLGHSTALGTSGLEVSAAELMQLASDLNALVQHDGLVFYPCQHDLLLASVAELGISTTPLHALRGQNIFPYLPKGMKSHYWHKLFTEIQMLCHQHAINLARSENSLATLDGLWFWGEGELPPTKPVLPWNAIYSDAPWLKDLAGFLDIPFYPLLANSSVLENDCLIVIESADYLNAYTHLLKTLLSVRSNKIILYPNDGYCYDLQQQTTSLWQRLMAAKSWLK